MPFHDQVRVLDEDTVNFEEVQPNVIHFLPLHDAHLSYAKDSFLNFRYLLNIILETGQI